LFILRNDDEEIVDNTGVMKRFSHASESNIIYLSLGLHDATEQLLAQFINNSERSLKSNEEQGTSTLVIIIGVGNTTDNIFESLKSKRDKRIKGIFESPRFHTLSSKQSFAMSIADKRGSVQSKRSFLISEGSLYLITSKGQNKSNFKRRSDMFSFNGENQNTIKEFLSSKKSSSSIGEDLASSKIKY